jgi:tetratricopeptide (TPR) repeat protein
VGFFSKIFARNSEDYLQKGDLLLEQQRFFEARNAYEDGLQRSEQLGKGSASLASIFIEKIAVANKALAELNIIEAEHAITLKSYVKAIEHLELAKTLTNDKNLREKTEELIKTIANNSNETTKLAPSSGCNSCTSVKHQMQVEAHCEEPNLSPLDYYDLLIRQLPSEMYSRYAELGESFAYMYLAASRDEHEQALKMLEDFASEINHDIYCYEKGMVLYRLGKVRQAEQYLKEAIGENAANPLPPLGLALLMIDSERFQEADALLASMMDCGILFDQSLFLRASISEMTENMDDAIEKYGKLLSTSFARPAAEKLFSLLTDSNRHQEAEAVFKRYLKGCQH